jgi:ribosome-associated protein
MSEQVTIRTEYIELAQLLKLADWVGTGGEAKLVIQDGEVQVNGELETRRGRKIRPGDKVQYGQKELEVAAG